MKTIISTVFISVSIIIIVILIDHPVTTNQETEIVIMRDITDPQLSQPQINEITNLFDLENEPWIGAKFRFVNITDLSLNRTYETNLNKENKWMGNEFERKKRIRKFSAEIEEIFANNKNDDKSKGNSSVYLPLVKELNRLSHSPSQKKMLLVYSDLMENTKELTFYEESNLHILKSKPENVMKYFEAQVPMENLSGIKIYLIYQPQDTEQDSQFKTVSDFYKKLLESKGANVEILANINLI